MCVCVGGALDRQVKSVNIVKPNAVQGYFRKAFIDFTVDDNVVYYIEI